MITIPTKSVNYDQENIKFVHNLSYFCFGKNYFPVLLTVRALLARSSKRNKRKVVSGSRVTLPENFACKPELSFNPLARVTLAVGLPYLLVNRALISIDFDDFTSPFTLKFLFRLRRHIKHLRQCFIDRLSKQLEFRQKYSAACRIFNSPLGAWISR